MTNYIYTNRFGHGTFRRYSVMKDAYNEIANVRKLVDAEAIASREFKRNGPCFIVDNEENKIVLRYEK